MVSSSWQTLVGGICKGAGEHFALKGVLEERKTASVTISVSLTSAKL